jgi:hypothetical protein
MLIAYATEKLTYSHFITTFCEDCLEESSVKIYEEREHHKESSLFCEIGNEGGQGIHFVGSPYLNQRRRKHALPRENGLC